MAGTLLDYGEPVLISAEMAREWCLDRVRLRLSASAHSRGHHANRRTASRTSLVTCSMAREALQNSGAKSLSD